MKNSNSKIYDFKKIESNWKDGWYKDNIYKAVDFSPKEKKYILVEFPYPSGKSMHIGHMMRYTLPEIYSRYLRMKGYNVMFPMGWDAFGLPAENYAIKTGNHPSTLTTELCKYYRSSMQDMGYGIDWDREINTSDPNYYKWTQWIFLKFFEQGLAQFKEEPVWFCEEMGTVLAEEEVEKAADGSLVSERGGYPVERKMFKQWILKLPKYADKLIEGLKKTDFPDSIKAAQTSWIGRSEGTRMKMNVFAADGKAIDAEGFAAFTTRVDTAFGITFVVMAPEHELVTKFLPFVTNRESVDKYINQAKAKTELERQQDKTKTGCKLDGVYAVSPFDDSQKIDIYIGDYVLKDYGTGIVIGVPAHDERDFEFALKNGIALKHVVSNGGKAFFGYVKREWSKDFDTFVKFVSQYKVITQDKDSISYTIEASAIDKWIEAAKVSAKNGAWHDIVGDKAVVVFGDGEIVEIEKYKEDAKTLAKMKELIGGDFEFKSIWEMYYEASRYQQYVCHTDYGKLIDSGKYTGMSSKDAIAQMQKDLEAIGMGSLEISYKIRDWIFSRQRYWGEPMPLIHKADGSIEAIAVTTDDESVKAYLPLQLPELPNYAPSKDGSSPLAADTEWCSTTAKDGSPATRETNTMPNWAGSCWYYLRYIDPKNTEALADFDKMKYWLPVDKYFGGSEHITLHLLYSRFWHKFLYDQGVVPTEEPYQWRQTGGILLGPDGRKMSKSYGNVVEPQPLMEKYGADALRTYVAFMGTYDGTFPFNEQGLNACHRLVSDIYSIDGLATECENPDLEHAFHKMLKRVTRMAEDMKFNTFVSDLMVFVKELKATDKIPVSLWKEFVKIVAPLAPFVAEELWQTANGFTAWKRENSVHLQSWPIFDESKTVEDTIEIPVQINGKVRGKVVVASDSDEATVRAAVEGDEKLAAHVASGIKKFIYVPNKIANVIV